MASTRIGDVTIPTVSPPGGYTDHATVLAVQKALAAQGYATSPDGIWGPKTKETLTSWQVDTYSPDQTVTGVIDYGVIMKLGVPAPGSAASAAAAQVASNLQTISKQVHAAYNPSDEDIAQEQQTQAAQAAVTAAKKKVATAITPQQQQAAQQQLVVAQQKLDAVSGGSFLTKEVLGRPVWQIGLFAFGGLVLTLGLVTVFGGKKKK